MNALITPRAFFSLSLLAASTIGIWGCAGSMKAEAKASSDAGAEGDVEFEMEPDGSGWEETADTQSEEQSQQGATAVQPTTPSGSSEVALLGARHDLLLKDGTTPNCQCLAAVLGQPNHPQMRWVGRMPKTDPSRQLVVALASEGVSCDEKGPGASYMGYEVRDGNVVVKVEGIVSGRPITHGAIIPRPPQGGKVVIEAQGKIPYGKGKGGESQCSLGSGQ